MVKQSLSRTMFLLLGLVAVFAVLRFQMWENPLDRYDRIIKQKRVQYTIDIHAKELDEFVRLLPEYKRLGLEKDFNVAYLDVLPSKALDWKKKIWFIYHHWDADRFYYVQQRLIYLLQALEIRRNSQGIIDLIAAKEQKMAAKKLAAKNKYEPKSKAKAAKDKQEEEEEEVLLQMLELQKQRIKVADMSFSELILITARERELRELLK